MPLTLTNYHSGELCLSSDSTNLRLSRGEATRLIMLARMHGVVDFLEKLPKLVPQADLLKEILSSFETAKTSTEKWNLKEKFARLQTLSTNFSPQESQSQSEWEKIVL